MGRTALSVNGIRVASAPAGGWWVVDRDWRVGHEVVLVLPLQPRFTAADPRRHAARGSVAPEYGPLVYCWNRSTTLVTGSTTSPSIPPGRLTWGLATAPSPV